MIGIDNHGFHIQENKLSVRTNLGFPRVKQVIEFIENEYTRLENHEIDRNQMKAKRLIEQTRKRETLDFLSQERERLQFSVEDIQSRMYDYYDAVLEEQSFITRFLQEYEMRLVYPKSKWSLKVAKFTLRILDDLHEVGDESSPEYGAREMENKAINFCQISIRNIINFQPLLWQTTIKRYLDVTMISDDPEKRPSIAFRYYAIQFLLLYTEYMVKYRVKQRRLDIFEILDVRYLAQLLPVLKQTLVRLTDHLRQSRASSTNSLHLTCPNTHSILKNEEEAEKELEERILLPLSVQCLRNVLELMQYLSELPQLVQSVLVEHCINAIYDPATPAITSYSSSSQNQVKSNLVGKKEIKEEFPPSAAVFSFNQYHLFHDIICLLCHHGSIHRHSSPTELSDASVAPVEIKSKDGKISERKTSPTRTRSGKTKSRANPLHTLSAAPAKSTNMFYHPSGRKFILGTGRRNLFHTSILPDILRCAIYYQVVVAQQLPTYRQANPIPMSPQLKKKLLLQANASNKATMPPTEMEMSPMDREQHRHSRMSMMSAWEQSLLPLAFRAVQRVLVILGRPGHVGAILPREQFYLQHLDDLIIQAADVTTEYYQQHPQYPQALAHRLAWALVQSLHYVSYHRLSAIFVQLSVSKLMFTSALPMFYFQTSPLADPIREALAKATLDAIAPISNPKTGDDKSVNNNQEAKFHAQIFRDCVQKYPEELLRDELLIMTQRLLASFAVHHKQSLAMTRMCCITLRLLFREIFVKRTQVEDLLSMNLTTLCAPYTASLTKLFIIRNEGGDDEDEEGIENGAGGGDTMMLMQGSMPTSPVGKPNFSASLYSTVSNDEENDEDLDDDDEGDEDSISSKDKKGAKQNRKNKRGKASNHSRAQNEMHQKPPKPSSSSSRMKPTTPYHASDQQAQHSLVTNSVTFNIPTGDSVSYHDFESHESNSIGTFSDHGEDTADAFSHSNNNSVIEDDASQTLVPETTGIAVIKARPGGILEEPTVDDVAHVSSKKRHEGDDDYEEDDNEQNNEEGYGILEGGDSLTTVSHGQNLLPPPSKDSKPNKSKGKRSNKNKDSLEASGGTSSQSKQDVSQSTSLGNSNVKSSTFSVDHYTQTRMFKHLPNPLVPKTLIDHSQSTVFEMEEKKDDKKDKKGNDNGSVSSETTATSYTATLSANASEGQVQEKQKKSMIKSAQKMLAKNAAENAAVVYVTLADILMSAAESHLSHAETFEQILLLVEHIASKSYLSKYVLSETGLPLILQRYLQSQPANLYLFSLTQLCLEALEI